MRWRISPILVGLQDKCIIDNQCPLAAFNHREIVTSLRLDPPLPLVVMSERLVISSDAHCHTATRFARCDQRHVQVSSVRLKLTSARKTALNDLVNIYCGVLKTCLRFLNAHDPRSSILYSSATLGQRSAFAYGMTGAGERNP